ncbi:MULTISPECIES: hypothetical protein [unclassified Blastococcus]|uniref:hypothetical protein n=1 Tax=unclassified Blastococcus TaxID=2619396 RepID=UPI001EEF8F91|nr:MULTISPECIES: hypothetical protein [unclassified Blastococcus]
MGSVDAVGLDRSGLIGVPRRGAAQVEDALSFVPGWLSAALVFGALAMVIVRAFRNRSSDVDPSPISPTDGEDSVVEPTETSPTGRS